MPFSMRQIATKAGVSVATVSRALNKPEKVLPETREKILEIIKELNYAPNPLAKALSTGKTNFIALIVPTLDNSFFAQLAEGCQNYLLQYGYNLIIISGQNYSEGELGILQNIDQRQIKGLLLSGSGFNIGEYKTIIENVKIPLVVIENLPKQYKVSSVYIDDVLGVKIAMDYFLKLGHEKIGIITGELEIITTKRRLEAVNNYLQEKNLDHSIYIVSGNYSSFSSGGKAFQELWNSSEKPTVIFAFNDILAIGAMKAAQKLNIKIPEELSIFGFDDIPMSDFCTPALTTIHSPSQQLGEEASKLLLEELNHKEEVKNILLPVSMVERDSCQ